MSKVALITGITGQDGAYLTEFLLKKGYTVHGIKRRSSLFNTNRIDHLFEGSDVINPKLFLHFGDMTDSSSLIQLIKKIEPDDIVELIFSSTFNNDVEEYLDHVSASVSIK